MLAAFHRWPGKAARDESASIVSRRSIYSGSREYFMAKQPHRLEPSIVTAWRANDREEMYDIREALIADFAV